MNSELVKQIGELIRLHLTFGYGRLWTILRFNEGLTVNCKTVYRILEHKRWFVHQQTATPRPRVHWRKGRTETSNRRWALNMTHVNGGRDEWAHFVAVIDCHDRELIGHEFASRGRAREAERALEQACIARFGTLRPHGTNSIVRSDNGLIFQSKRFRATCKNYRLNQEFITPYTPEQNGIAERFLRSLKEERLRQHNFKSLEEVAAAIRKWIAWYNERRPHHALGNKSPREFRAQELSVA